MKAIRKERRILLQIFQKFLLILVILKNNFMGV